MTNRPYTLIVEDNDDLRAVMEEALVGDGREVVAVRDGQAALTALRSLEPPCLVLCDLRLPDLHGRAIVAECQSTPRLASTKVVVVTGLPQLAPAGVQVLTKPFDTRVLLDLARQWCAGPEAAARAPDG